METLETRDFDVAAGSVVLPADYLETRREGLTQFIRGFFPYESRTTIADRGPIRKEEFGPKAFSFAVNDPEREITLLYGHRFQDPLASKLAGTLDLQDTKEGLLFEARLPTPETQTELQREVLRLFKNKLIGGVSPGFRIPPKLTVPEAETLFPEPGNPGVQIRRIKDAILYELSLVNRAAYKTAVWTQKSRLHTRLTMFGGAGILLKLEELFGKDFLTRLRKLDDKASRLRAKNRQTFDEIVDELTADGLTLEDAQNEAESLVANNLAVDIRRDDPGAEDLEFYRWIL
ncbi:MAG: HK97 family phage prohead protease [Deltaproteobacteria bacterium]|nr:HK97 family phage prohead protease [Deltaproteobacteria bacterium]